MLVKIDADNLMLVAKWILFIYQAMILDYFKQFLVADFFV